MSIKEAIDKTPTSTNNIHLNCFAIDKKNQLLQEIRHEIKKKRLLFDENKERFGLTEMTQLVKVKNTSEVKGYPFKAIIKNQKLENIALKLLPIETKYEKHEHPSNIEIIVLKHLTDNIVNAHISPHITHYLGIQKINNKSRALKMLNLKRLEVEDKIKTHSYMLISEFLDGGSLDNWVFNTYENDKDISNNQWKYIVFQLVYTISVMQHHYRMMHNDFHYGNILIDTRIKPGGYLVYEINNKIYYIPNTGIIPKLWDFEFCMSFSDKIPGMYPNKFIVGPYKYDKTLHKTLDVPTVDNLTKKQKPSETQDSDELCTEDLNVPFNYNQVYDLHYFLTSLLDLYISQELFDFIIGLYPVELIPEDDNSSNYTSRSSHSHSSHSHSSHSSRSRSSHSLRSRSSNSESINVSLSPSSSSSSSSSNSNLYLSNGRMLNGIEEKFTLPNPIDILNNPFFESFTTKPHDFDEKTASYFKAGF
jgi:hypothetical protein